MHGTPKGNLDGFRILDLSGESGFLAGMLLAQLGAEVIKGEPPRGDAARWRGPFVGGVAEPDRSILWLALNSGKRGVTVDLSRDAGRDVFQKLCGSAAAVIHSRDGLSELGSEIAYDTLCQLHPSLVLCVISPFGLQGPYREYRGSDLSAVALGGNLYPTGNPDRPPVRCSLPVSYYHGALEAAAAVTFGLYARELHGSGQLIDISLQEVMCMPNMTTPTQFPFTGFKGGRVGGGFRGAKAAFRELWPCKDGYVSFALRGGPARNPGIVALLAYMDENGMAPPALKERNWLQYNHNLVSQEEVDVIEAALSAFFANKTMSELFATACERNLMLAPANTARQIVESRQAAAREFFVEIEHEDLALRIRYPGAFAKNNLDNIAFRGRAPRLGEHNQEVYGGLGLDVASLHAAGAI